MKRTHAATLVLLAVALTTTLVADPPVRVDIDVDPTRQPEREKVEPIEAKAPPEAVVEGMNAFGFDLYGHLASMDAMKNKNLFYSPTSIASALAMTYAGARGNTADQMAEVLNLPERNIHEGYGTFIDYINAVGQSKRFDLTLVNALWGQQGFGFREEFTGLLDKTYEAGLRRVDYVGATEDARQTINSWVEKQTNDKIENLIPRGALNQMTRLVLTNAIYFNGTWQHKFDPKSTREMPFTTAAGKKTETKTMYQKSRFGYAETDDVQCLQMPYKGSDIAMMVLLPKKADGLEALEKSLDAKSIADWADRLKTKKVRVYLPKFKMTYDVTLNPILKSMGMTDAFSLPPADFSGMTGQKDLFISVVVHKAFVDVNETGTEAAAATGVVMSATSAMIPPPPTFKADHPFVFLIRETKTGAVLFGGRLCEPSTE